MDRITKTIKFIIKHPLNRNNPFKAILRYIRWQIGSRLQPGSVAMPFVGQSRLLISPGMTGATGNVYTGLHDFEDMSFVRHLVRQDDMFIDIGANVGVYTILAAGGGARCVAIEPAPSTYEKLLDNLHLNRLMDRVTPMNIGLAKTPGILNFTRGLDTMNRVIPASGPGNLVPLKVPVETLDNITNGMPEMTPCCIKVDVEGFEQEVLSGGKRAFSNDQLLAVVLEINEGSRQYGLEPADTHKKMLSLGFQAMKYAPFERMLSEIAGWNPTGNTLYIRGSRQQEIEERLKTALQFQCREHRI